MRRAQGLMDTIAQFVHFLAEENNTKPKKKKTKAFYDSSRRPPAAWARIIIGLSYQGQTQLDAVFNPRRIFVIILTSSCSDYSAEFKV